MESNKKHRTFAQAKNMKKASFNVQSKKAKQTKNAEDNTTSVPLQLPENIVSASSSDEHIDHLLVTGKGQATVDMLKAIEHRVDENSTICIMNDGLGVLEDVKQNIFNGTNQPKLMLGHMSHRIAYLDNAGTIRQLRDGQMQVTTPSLWLDQQDMDEYTADKRNGLVQSIGTARRLNLRHTRFDEWLRFKLPSVIFSAAAEPVCVLLDMRMDGLLQNNPARQLMWTVLDEITQVLENLPELEGSPTIRNYLRGTRMKQNLYSNIVAQKARPSALSYAIARNKPMDIDYTAGYFVKRAEEIGVKVGTLKMLLHTVKAKHSIQWEKHNSYIPIEETSVPSEMAHRLRTLPQGWHTWRN